jgi:hypothetical protein
MQAEGIIDSHVDLVPALFPASFFQHLVFRDEKVVLVDVDLDTRRSAVEVLQRFRAVLP